MVIYTIGYGNKTLKEVLAQIQLETKTENIIIDVRAINSAGYSGDFEMMMLKITLGDLGIGYHWMGDKLGSKNLNPPRYKDAEIEDKIKEKEAKFVEGCHELVTWMKNYPNSSIVLLCALFNPYRCHRHTVIETKFKELYPEIEFKHILWNKEDNGLFN